MNQTSHQATNIRRLQNEVKQLLDSNIEYQKMFKLSMVNDDMYHWDIVLYGPEDSLYHGYQYKLDLVLPNNYPYSPPRIKFISSIQHLNISKDGEICLDILKNKWSAAQNIRTVLLSIILLMSQPNPDDPFNHDLATLYRTNKEEYITNVKNHCKDHNEPIN